MKNSSSAFILFAAFFATSSLVTFAEEYNDFPCSTSDYQCHYNRRLQQKPKQHFCKTRERVEVPVGAVQVADPCIKCECHKGYYWVRCFRVYCPQQVNPCKTRWVKIPGQCCYVCDERKYRNYAPVNQLASKKQAVHVKPHETVKVTLPTTTRTTTTTVEKRNTISKYFTFTVPAQTRTTTAPKQHTCMDRERNPQPVGKVSSKVQCMECICDEGKYWVTCSYKKCETPKGCTFGYQKLPGECCYTCKSKPDFCLDPSNGRHPIGQVQMNDPCKKCACIRGEQYIKCTETACPAPTGCDYGTYTPKGQCCSICKPTPPPPPPHFCIDEDSNTHLVGSVETSDSCTKCECLEGEMWIRCYRAENC